MLKNLAAPAVAAAALALGAPAVAADAPRYDCRLRTVQQDDVTGASYRGVLAGVVAHADTSAVSIRCRIDVNGVTQAETPVGSGTTVAATHQEVSFAVADGDVVRVCADHTSSHGSGTSCVTLGTFHIPPDYVFEMIDPPPREILSDIYEVVDPAICEVLKLLAGSHADTVYVNPQGDVYLHGEPQWDCPPYDIVWD